MAIPARNTCNAAPGRRSDIMVESTSAAQVKPGVLPHADHPQPTAPQHRCVKEIS